MVATQLPWSQVSKQELLKVRVEKESFNYDVDSMAIPAFRRASLDAYNAKSAPKMYTKMPSTECIGLCKGLQRKEKAHQMELKGEHGLDLKSFDQNLNPEFI
ncbi:hypothetical protein Tco_0918720 [Tanacetum coccineum]